MKTKIWGSQETKGGEKEGGCGQLAVVWVSGTP